TQAVPKVAVVATGEQSCSLEDSILLALLHNACFDVVLFVPTGYQIIEKYYTEPFFTEHQAGEYLYDLQPPYLSASSPSGEGILSRFFRRGHT
ncbi:MAG: YceG family protein, partial [Butyricicoccus sp.]